MRELKFNEMWGARNAYDIRKDLLNFNDLNVAARLGNWGAVGSGLFKR
jgi:hypothetical protein